MPSDGYARVRDLFAARWGGHPDVVERSPGRVNLIGDHTDYNDGFVLPMAIDRQMWLAARHSSDRKVRIASDGHEPVELSIDSLEHRDPRWGEYVAGVAWSLLEAGYDLTGWEGALVSEVPVGAGLSSSAALELAAAQVFAALGELPWEPVAMARLAQRAENEWVGMACGIMDQLVVAAAAGDAALLIDCRSLQTTPVPIPAGAAVVVFDSGTRRRLVGSQYNERRAACEAAAAALGVPALRDADLAGLDTADVDAVVRRRARHVITENARVLDAVDALRAGDLERVGSLMRASHSSLRNDFEVSTNALDRVVELAGEAGAFGARLTGAGFGGCVVALIEEGAADRVITDVLDGSREFGLERATAYRTAPVAGVSPVV